MATVTGFTAAKMQEIMDSVIQSATINTLGNLIFTRADGSEIDAGYFGLKAKTITVATDFDTLTTPGAYLFTSNTVVAASANKPAAATYGFTTGNAGFLLVEGDGANFVKQSWTNYNTPSENVLRTRYNMNWNLWGPYSEMASSTQAGLVELATAAEAALETDTTRAVTPQGLANQRGYRFLQTLSFAANGTFSKATYTGLRAVRVRVQAGGGAGGACGLANSGNHSAGGGGGGGGYAEGFILASALAASETITVGAGGGAGGGGVSSFGTKVSATGGANGDFFNNTAVMLAALGGEGGIGTAGDLLVAGGVGQSGTGYATLGHGGAGGSSALGGGGIGTFSPASAAVNTGQPGNGYGGGGSGASANTVSIGGAAGGAGAPGIVIVDLYV